MNRNTSISQFNTRNRRRPSARQSALDRIDAALDRQHHQGNADLIRRMREVYFADVDALERSGQIKLPE